MTKADVEREVERYMALPYHIELIPSVEGGYVVRIPDLPGCLSEGDTAEEAVEMIRDAQRGWLEVTLENGQPIPEPTGGADWGAAAKEYSGKFNVRLPRDLHRDLVAVAKA